MMKFINEIIEIFTEDDMEIVNVTDEVSKIVTKSKIEEGLCLVNSMHITSSVFINDEEAGLKEDFIKWLEDLAPFEKDKYQHNLTDGDNAHAHLKRTIMGREVVVSVSDGKLDLGRWEQIFYGEFDGRRKKKVLVKIIGE